VFFSAWFFKKPPENRSGIGCVREAELFGKQPEIVLLKKIESSGATTLATSESFGLKPNPSPFMAHIVETGLNAAVSNSRNGDALLFSMWSGGELGRIKRDYVIASDESTMSDQTEDDVNSLFEKAKINATTDDVSLGDLRQRLLNLKIKIAVLVKDQFVFTESRMTRIQSEILAIQRALDSAEEERMKVIQYEYKETAARIRNAYRENSDSRQAELKRKAAEMMADAESAVKMMVAERAAKTKDRIKSLSQIRTTARKSVSAAAEVRSVSPPDFSSIYMEASKEFSRRLRRKAPAVAERCGVGLIFNSPYPPVGKTKLLDNEFGN